MTISYIHIPPLRKALLRIRAFYLHSPSRPNMKQTMRDNSNPFLMSFGLCRLHLWSNTLNYCHTLRKTELRLESADASSLNPRVSIETTIRVKWRAKRIRSLNKGINLRETVPRTENLNLLAKKKICRIKGMAKKLILERTVKEKPEEYLSLKETLTSLKTVIRTKKCFVIAKRRNAWNYIAIASG